MTRSVTTSQAQTAFKSALFLQIIHLSMTSTSHSFFTIIGAKSDEFQEKQEDWSPWSNGKVPGSSREIIYPHTYFNCSHA